MVQASEIVQTELRNVNWWHRRTTLEKTLAVLCTVCFLAITALIIFLVGLMTQDNKLNDNEQKLSAAHEEIYPKLKAIKKDEICLTPACIHAASKMIQQMDIMVQPCDDFYNFACGTFIKETRIPDDKTEVSASTLIEDKLQKKLDNILSEQIIETEARPFKLAKHIYKTCMNKTLIEARGMKPFDDIVDTFGGWPVVKADGWDETNWTWTQTIQNFRSNGYSTSQIFSISVDTDPKNSTKRIIDIDQAFLGLSREYLIQGMNDTIVQAYYRYMVDMAVLFGADNKTRVEEEILESLEFEIGLANISLPQEERRNTTLQYNLFSIKELQYKFPYVEWLDYINSILYKDVQIDEDEIINVSVPSFFEQLGELLENTPERTIANYMIWRITAYSSYFLTENLRKRKLKYNTVISGNLAQVPRWKECVSVSSSSFDIAVGALYVRKYFKEDSKTAALDMVQHIKIEFRKILKFVPWMDETTRNSALVKLDKMTTHIGYPDELMDDKKIIEFYKDDTVDEDKYLESILKINVFATDRVFKKLREPVNKTDWRNHAIPAEVNAFYDSIENSIEFPAGILQGQFFNVDWPKYLNYGAIGSVIAHEIIHGYDDEGRQFDLDGNLVDWWQKETEIAFLAKAKCIIEQYGNYTDTNVNLKLNGINTQGENIADIGGIKEAYFAYMKLVNDTGKELTLPGLDYTPQQLFWISAAQTWCSVSRPESIKMDITTGVHSPDKFRVLGPFSNMREFSIDYNCPKGSVMNPTKRCEIW